MNLRMRKELRLVFCEQLISLTKDTAAIQKDWFLMNFECSCFQNNSCNSLFQHIQPRKVLKEKNNLSLMYS